MTRIYLVSYDLRQPGRNYAALYDAIRSYDSWAHVMESTWAIATTSSASQVRDHLLSKMDANDRLIVSRQSGEAAWHNLVADVSSWLKINLERNALSV
jgi:hypothetical protein